ncbi:NADP-binding protein [Dacryopinax primogenitus]|uniref:NADP-binding protein n=1 Tax=Dacryopinax primogenitus (strain DJM 731) TaxID=1858805 RepID=M5GF13_DACPD|nr:NADP-binding protein [Dacryopinax primogenitus]EJU05887.1 NADP-binding protein [Dacryopinax primogenitus]
MQPSVYLISGANRGIGLELVNQLITRPDTIVFACARNPPSATALHDLAAKHTGRLHILKLNSADRGDNDGSFAEVERIAGKLDVLIANAGICSWFGPGLEVPEEVMLDHFRVNALGPLVLFQAASHLLLRSANPKFVLISSGAGSINSGAPMPVGMLPYGASKAAANYIMRKLHYEHPGLCVVVISPGGVATDMARFASGADPVMRTAAIIGVEKSASGCLKIVDEARREEDGPKMKNYDGGVWEW